MSQELKPKKRWRTIDFVLPTGAIRRTTQSIGRTADVIKQTAKDMKAALPDQAMAGDFPEGDLRNISDPGERFEAMYALHEWTPMELSQQVRTLKRTKMTAMCVSVLSLIGIVWLATSSALWVSIFLIPASGSLLILGFAQAFKYALFETQILLREFISARQFVERDDFWLRLFG